MKILFESQFIKILWDSENLILHNQWLLGTSEMNDDGYKKMALQQLQSIKEVNPKRWLVNLTDLKYIARPLVHEWADSLFPEILAAGVKYIAFVNSKDIVAQIAVEQLTEEKNVVASHFQIQFFDETQKAVEWLINK